MGKNKLILPTTILLASIILGAFIFGSQIMKQRSIEKQQQMDIQEKQSESKTATAKYEKEYTANRKKDCYEIEEAEREKYNNVVWSRYDAEKDICKVWYENKTGGWDVKIF